MQEEENELEEAEENEESTDVKFLQVPNQRHKFNLTNGNPFCIGRRGSCSTIEFLSQMNNEMKQQYSDNQIVRNQPNIQVSTSCYNLKYRSGLGIHLLPFRLLKAFQIFFFEC